jgi:hypothetical protein
MKQLMIAGIFVSLASTAQAVDCAGLERQINTLMAQAQNAQGICQAARISVRLYDAAGDYNWSCVSGGKDQAREYYRARDQAQQTANASCY